MSDIQSGSGRAELVMKYLLTLFMLLVVHEPRILLADPKNSEPLSTDWVSLKESDEIGRYFRKDNLIHVHVNGMISEKLTNADPISFRVHKTFSEFGRDETHAWFIDIELDVDKPSWEIISQSYSKDRMKVLCGAQELSSADPKTFKVILDGLNEWGADRDSVYNQWFKLEHSDPRTFQFIDDSFSKDRSNVYYNQDRLDGADPKSFEIIKGNVARDKNAIFAFGSKMPSYVDISTIQVPGDGYIYDKNGRYHLQRGEWIKTTNK